MAMFLGEGNPLGALMGKSAGEEALQPWWDSVGDYLIYGLIGLGKLTSKL